MLEVIDLIVCLRSSVEILYLPTIGIIVSMVFQVIYATIGIRVYQFRHNTAKVSDLKILLEFLIVAGIITLIIRIGIVLNVG